MVDNPPEGFQSQGAFSDFFMPVLMAGKRVLRIIQVNRFQMGQTDHPVKFPQNAVKVSHNIVSPVVYMAGIQTDPHFFLSLHLLPDGRQFLKPAPHLGSLSRHGFQQQRGMPVLQLQDPVQRIGNHPDPGFRPLSHMAAGMKIVAAARHILHAS